MGTYYSAVAILGVEFKMPDRLLSYETTHSCDHPERHGHKFCPKCGKKVWAKDEIDYSEIYDIEETIREGVPEGYQFVEKDNTKSYVIGYGMSIHEHDGNDHKVMPLPDPVEVAGAIMALLEEAEIPDAYPKDQQVALHCMMDGR